MFRSKTLFVLGAGSSHEVGLPIGDGLKDDIANKINIGFEFGARQVCGDVQIMQALWDHTAQPDGRRGDPNPYLMRARELREALPLAISIDNLLDAHRGDELAETCGKLGIVKCILEAERKSSLYFDPTQRTTIDFIRSVNSWFAGFMKMLTEGVARTELDTIFSNIRIVNFNYDRCLEHYLLHSLRAYYSVDENVAKSALNRLKVHRPYGQIAKLPWQKEVQTDVSFGAERVRLLEISKQIKTFNERITDSAEMLAWRKDFEEAEVIVFLGFAFHRQNLELLAPGAVCNAKRIYATAFNVSGNDCATLLGEVRTLLGQERRQAKVEIRNDLKCASLFNEYWRSLTAG